MRLKSCLVTLILVKVISFHGNYTSDNTGIQCGVAVCKNNGTCQTTQEGNQTVYQCRCQEGWTGNQCQAKIRLSVLSVSSTAIDLLVSSLPPMSDTARSEAGTQDFSYTVQYWQVNQSSTCNIVTGVIGRSLALAGLSPETEYIVCAKSVPVSWCYPFQLSGLNSSVNCMSVMTREKGYYSPGQQEERPPSFLLPLILSAGGCLLIILFLTLYCTVVRDRCGPRHKSRSKSRTGSSATLQEMQLLTNSPSSARMTINTPASPGKPKHQLSKRAAGYVSFSARNEQRLVLKTVVEYGGAGDGEEEGDGGEGESLVRDQSRSVTQPEPAFIS